MNPKVRDNDAFQKTQQVTHFLVHNMNPKIRDSDVLQKTQHDSENSR